MVINKADKGGAVVLQNGGEYMKEDAQQLLTGMFYQILNSEAPKKDSCVRRSTKCTEVEIEDRVLEVSFFNQGAHCID